MAADGHAGTVALARGVGLERGGDGLLLEGYRGPSSGTLERDGGSGGLERGLRTHLGPTSFRGSRPIIPLGLMSLGASPVDLSRLA